MTKKVVEIMKNFKKSTSFDDPHGMSSYRYGL
jgi:hypothetical protein